MRKKANNQPALVRNQIKTGIKTQALQSSQNKKTTALKSRHKLPKNKKIDQPLRLNKRLLTFFLIVVFLVAYYFYSQRAGSVTGKVFHAINNETLANAKVQLDERKLITVNNITGAFSFADVYKGRHQLHIEAPGFISKNVEIDLNAGQLLRFDIQLDPEQSQDGLKGDYVLLLTRNPDALMISDPKRNFLTRKRIPIETRPSDMVIINKEAYVSEPSKDRITRIHLEQGRIRGQIQLPQYSGPSKMLKLPGRNALAVLNPVSQTLAYVDLDSQQMREQLLKLPLNPIDMILSADGSKFYVLGGDKVLSIDSDLNYIISEYDFRGSQKSTFLRFAPNINKLITLADQKLLLLDPLSGKSEARAFNHNFTNALPMSHSEVLLASRQNVIVFNLLQNRYVGSAIALEGDVSDIAPFGKKWLLSLKNPDHFVTLNAQRGQIEGDHQSPGRIVALQSSSF